MSLNTGPIIGGCRKPGGRAMPMITTLEQNRVTVHQNEVLSKCASLLHPKLKRLLNPNVVDVKLRLSLHVANGAVNHYRDWDNEPAYCTEHARGWASDDDSVSEVLKLCLKVLNGRIDSRVGHGWHGIITLNVDIAGDSVSVSSEVDAVHRVANPEDDRTRRLG